MLADRLGISVAEFGGWEQPSVRTRPNAATGWSAALSPWRQLELGRRMRAIDSGDVQCEAWRGFGSDRGYESPLTLVMLAPAALYEILDAASAYQATKHGTGDQFLQRVRDALGRLTILQTGNVTLVAVRDFPYCLAVRGGGHHTEVLGLEPIPRREWRANGHRVSRCAA